LKVFLDEGVPERLAKHLPGHQVESVGWLGWKGTRNGRLLAAVEAAGFHAMITNDKQMDNQQRLLRRQFAVLILSATNWPVIEPHVAKIAEAVDNCKPGTVTWVECGRFMPSKFRGPVA
jgi:predicted nuclease of predicted toxin-antitoxin system